MANHYISYIYSCASVRSSEGSSDGDERDAARTRRPARFTLVFKRGDPLLWLFAGLSWLLGGVFYPLEVLPRFLQHAGQLLPITHALVGMRAALLRNASILELLPQIGVLGVFALVGLPLSLLAFH